MKFRTDINGLRAYAVLAVIIFHFNKQWLSGGFAGVDVFFVISGYLMTSIIFRGLENNKFSIWKFYAARIKRIVPALLVLIITLMVFGYYFLAPTAYMELSKHSGGSLLFISNIMYWKESGYFDAAAIEKFLLHTWSLSVEWQFYIIYPIGLLLLAKLFKIDTVKKIVAISTVLALIFSIYASQRWSVASYFLLPTRMWEMLLGGIAFLYPFELRKQSEKHILELSGLALILVSFFIISENTIWPGYAALIPTLGAFILIQANNDKSIFTNNIVCQKLGLWSYSLYLWHWSLLATYNYFGYKVKFFPFFFVTLACGITSYYLIEKRKFNVITVLLASAIVLGGTYFVYTEKGIRDRFAGSIDIANFEKTNTIPHDCTTTGICILGDPNDISAIMVGDSHANAITTGLLEQQGRGIIAYNTHSCPFILGALIKGSEDICFQKNNSRFTEITHYTNTPIVISSRWVAYIDGQNSENRINEPGGRATPLYFNPSQKNHDIKPEDALSEFEEYFEKTICKLRETNDKIYIVQPIPEMLSSIPDTVISNIMQRKNKPTYITLDEYYQRSGKVRDAIQRIAEKCDTKVLDPVPFLCDDKICNGLKDGRPIYYDSDHLSEFGNKLLVPMFDQISQD